MPIDEVAEGKQKKKKRMNKMQTENEINDWLDQNGHFTFIANEQNYINEKYGD